MDSVNLKSYTLKITHSQKEQLDMETIIRKCFKNQTDRDCNRSGLGNAIILILLVPLS